MFLIKKKRKIFKTTILIGLLSMIFAGLLVAGNVSAENEKKLEENLIFEPLYYDQKTSFGIIKDTNGVAVGEKGAYFKVQIKKNGAHQIFYIEVYPEYLSEPPGTHVDEFPADIITMLLETYPKYNLPVRK